MNLAASNIAWSKDEDGLVLSRMKRLGYSGLEIAPTRIFPDDPYDKLDMARTWAGEIVHDYGFVIPSMQSIWYGRNERIFGTEDERKALLEYTKRAIDFAGTVGCKNLVFGCPKNRNMPDGSDLEVAVFFFRELGNYASEHGVSIGLEANPVIYNTNFINDTPSALKLIKKVDSPGFKLNLDVGTMIYNGESAGELSGNVSLISHVHISEPGLLPIEKRPLHAQLKEILAAESYQGFISIEMGKQKDTRAIEDALLYVSGLFD